MQRSFLLKLIYFLTSLCVCSTVFAQRPAATPPPGATLRGATDTPRPPLFFREAWKKVPKETPITQQWVGNPNLELKLYGPGAGGSDSEHTLNINYRGGLDDVAFIWSGMTEGNWALTLKEKNNYVDLSGPLTKIRWRVLESGFHLLRPVIKLADGTYLVGDHTDSVSVDWRVTEFALADVHWFKLDPKNVYEAPTLDGSSGYGLVANPDLKRVDEVGFTDLTRGSGHGAGGSSRVAWIEVYGYPVPRSVSAK
jgi:hypothetical protein